MALLHSFPPHWLHSSCRIAPLEALSLLSSYLVAATEQPYLQPNALLTEGGPVSATSGPNTSLTLHNLQRVAAGLRGEHLSVELLVDKHDSEGLPDMRVKGHDLAYNMLTALPSREMAYSGDLNMDAEGWQDKTEFEREQDITQGEVGDRLQGVTDLLGEDVEVPLVHVTRTDSGKEDRKRRKQERRKAEKAEIEAQKAEAGLNRR
ncbi:hypothetical protein MMC34_003554 [Xylographa carneopallida]|nr:hypothetical protein [Xylographa carneopallida]